MMVDDLIHDMVVWLLTYAGCAITCLVSYRVFFRNRGKTEKKGMQTVVEHTNT